MEAVRRVAENTGFTIMGKVVSVLIRLTATILLTRYLGASGFGIYSFVFAYLSFFIIITDLGIGMILVREISRDRTKADRFVGNGVIINIILSIFAIALACLIISFLHYSSNVKLLVYIASLSFLLSFRFSFDLIFRVDLKMQYSSLAQILSNILRLVLFLYLIFLKAGLLWFIIVEIIHLFSHSCLVLLLSRKFVKPRFAIDWAMWKYLFRESWPLALIAVFTVIHIRIDQLMLFQMKGNQALGYYAAAVKLPETLGVFSSAFMISVYPLMSKYFNISKQSLAQAYTLSFRYLLMFIIPIAMVVTILSKPLILLFYGKGFFSSVPALSILSWSEVFVYYGLIHYQILIATNQQRLYLLFIAVGTVVNVILNLIMIPRYGIVGASVATLISYMLSAGLIIGHLLPATRTYNVVGFKSMIKPLVASIVMGIYVYCLRFHLILAIMGGIIIFILTMLVIRGINQEDIRLIKAIFNRNPQYRTED